MTGRGTVVDIDAEAIAHNALVLSALARKHAPASSLCAIIKADGYGHGAVGVARSLQGLLQSSTTDGIPVVSMLGVALVEEGIALRDAGIKTPILVLSGATAEPTIMQDVVGYDLMPVLWSLQQCAQYRKALGQRTGRAHLKLNSGMNRLGVKLKSLPDLLNAVQEYGIQIDGWMSHFANADVGDAASVAEQRSVFEEASLLVNQVGGTPQWVHMANSAALLHCEGHGHQVDRAASWRGLLPTDTMVRPGLALYGIDPRPDAVGNHDLGLQPVMRWRTRPLAIHTVQPGESVSYGHRWTAPTQSVIAVLPVGYADGYSYRLSNQGTVLLKGQRYPVVGSVCMDMILVDITGASNPSLNDSYVLLGKQKKEEITAAELAAKIGTIPYEIVCGVGARVPRRW